MKTATEIADHPKARLHREIVARLRDSGSVYGAKETWGRFQLNARLWKRIVTYGLTQGALICTAKIVETSTEKTRRKNGKSESSA